MPRPAPSAPSSTSPASFPRPNDTCASAQKQAMVVSATTAVHHGRSLPRMSRPPQRSPSRRFAPRLRTAIATTVCGCGPVAAQLSLSRCSTPCPSLRIGGDRFPQSHSLAVMKPGCGLPTGGGRGTLFSVITKVRESTFPSFLFSAREDLGRGREQEENTRDTRRTRDRIPTIQISSSNRANFAWLFLGSNFAWTMKLPWYK